MKFNFPAINKAYTYLQTNRSDIIGSLWSTFNIDFQTNLAAIRAAQRLVAQTSGASIGRTSAFQVFRNTWYATTGDEIYQRSVSGLTTGSFAAQTAAYSVGDSTSQFDVTNPAGTTFRYTYDGTGTNPGITALTFPIGALVSVSGTNMAAGNNTSGTITGSGSNYFEITNASGVVESNKTIGSGSILIVGGSLATSYDPNVSDLALFNGRLWATATSALRSLASSGTWTKRDDLGTSVHKLCYFKKFDQLYYVDTNVIISSIDTSDIVYNTGAGDYSINIGASNGIITTMVANSTYIWIATLRVNDVTADAIGTVGSIYSWDGISAQITAKYDIQAAGVLAMVVLNDIPYAIDSEGRILKYNGYAFEEIARLPVDRILLVGATMETNTNGRFCHFNGMEATKNNTLLVNINNLNDDDDETVNENLPSGVWELDLDTLNFTHRYSFSLKALLSSTITDFGQNKVIGVGAIKMNTLGTTSSGGKSTILASAAIYSDATTELDVIALDAPAEQDTNVEGQKRAYFVTTWFNSQEVQDKFVRLWTTFRRFLASTDRIIFKYRLNEEAPVYATITWVDTTHFTTTTDITAYGPTATGFNGTSGGEVEVLQGTGSGACAHITSVVNNAGTYTVTLDNAITGVTTGTAKARFQKWLKMFPEITGQVKSWADIAMGGSNVRVQVKCCMEFTGADEFYKFVIQSNEDITVTP